MTCDEMKPLLMGYVDGELGEGDVERVREHLGACAACRRDLEAFRDLVKETEPMKLKEPTDEILDRFWRSLYNRIEHGSGWVLVMAGAALVLAYGIYEFLRDPGVDILIKVGIASVLAGFAILLISVLRERIKVARHDRYSKEVER